MPANVTISGTVTGLPSGTKSLAAALVNGTTVGQTTDVTLASGDNTIAVPSGAIGVLIVPPASNTQALKLKGAGGDTGVLLSKTNATLLSLDPGQSSFIVNAAALTSAATEFNFF